MRKVILESPYAPKSEDVLEFALQLQRNLMYARAAMHDCFLQGDAPYASHLLYTQEGVLDDTVPEERNLGIEAGLIWGESAEATVVYTDLGMSKGMRLGIERAEAAGRPVEYRELGGFWSQFQS